MSSRMLGDLQALARQYDGTVGPEHQQERQGAGSHDHGSVSADRYAVSNSADNSMRDPAISPFRRCGEADKSKQRWTVQLPSPARVDANPTDVGQLIDGDGDGDRKADGSGDERSAPKVDPTRAGSFIMRVTLTKQDRTEEHLHVIQVMPRGAKDETESEAHSTLQSATRRLNCEYQVAEHLLSSSASSSVAADRDPFLYRVMRCPGVSQHGLPLVAVMEAESERRRLLTAAAAAAVELTEADRRAVSPSAKSQGIATASGLARHLPSASPTKAAQGFHQPHGRSRIGGISPSAASRLSPQRISTAAAGKEKVRKGKEVETVPPAVAHPNAVRFATNAALSLWHSHRYGVAHRNVSPYTLVTSDDGGACLTQFSSAAFVQLPDDNRKPFNTAPTALLQAECPYRLWDRSVHPQQTITDGSDCADNTISSTSMFVDSPVQDSARSIPPPACKATLASLFGQPTGPLPEIIPWTSPRPHAPELVAALAARKDIFYNAFAVDVWDLGVTIHYALTGQYPTVVHETTAQAASQGQGKSATAPKTPTRNAGMTGTPKARRVSSPLLTTAGASRRPLSPSTTTRAVASGGTVGGRSAMSARNSITDAQQYRAFATTATVSSSTATSGRSMDRFHFFPSSCTVTLHQDVKGQARAFLELLLSPDPALRPDMGTVVTAPFLAAELAAIVGASYDEWKIPTSGINPHVSASTSALALEPCVSAWSPHCLSAEFERIRDLVLSSRHRSVLDRAAGATGIRDDADDDGEDDAEYQRTVLAFNSLLLGHAMHHCVLSREHHRLPTGVASQSAVKGRTAVTPTPIQRRATPTQAIGSRVGSRISTPTSSAAASSRQSPAQRTPAGGTRDTTPRQRQAVTPLQKRRPISGTSVTSQTAASFAPLRPMVAVPSHHDDSTTTPLRRATPTSGPSTTQSTPSGTPTRRLTPLRSAMAVSSLQQRRDVGTSAASRLQQTTQAQPHSTTQSKQQPTITTTKPQSRYGPRHSPLPAVASTSTAAGLRKGTSPTPTPTGTPIATPLVTPSPLSFSSALLDHASQALFTGELPRPSEELRLFDEAAPLDSVRSSKLFSDVIARRSEREQSQATAMESLRASRAGRSTALPSAVPTGDDGVVGASADGVLLSRCGSTSSVPTPGDTDNLVTSATAIGKDIGGGACSTEGPMVTSLGVVDDGDVTFKEVTPATALHADPCLVRCDDASSSHFTPAAAVAATGQLQQAVANSPSRTSSRATTPTGRRLGTPTQRSSPVPPLQLRHVAGYKSAPRSPSHNPGSLGIRQAIARLPRSLPTSPSATRTETPLRGTPAAGLGCAGGRRTPERPTVKSPVILSSRKASPFSSSQPHTGAGKENGSPNARAVPVVPTSPPPSNPRGSPDNAPFE